MNYKFINAKGSKTFGVFCGKKNIDFAIVKEGASMNFLKTVLSILCLSILSSCIDNSMKEKGNSKSDSSLLVVKQENPVDVNDSIYFISKNDRLNSLREKIQGKLLDDTIWKRTELLI